MSGRHQRRRQHAVVIFRAAFASEPGRAMRALDLPRAIILRAVERDQHVPVEAAEHVKAAIDLPKRPVSGGFPPPLTSPKTRMSRRSRSSCMRCTKSSVHPATVVAQVCTGWAFELRDSTPSSPSSSIVQPLGSSSGKHAGAMLQNLANSSYRQFDPPCGSSITRAGWIAPSIRTPWE